MRKLKKIEKKLQVDEGNMCFITPCRKGHIDAVRLLIENGADVNVRAKNGNTGLCEASFMGHLDIVKLLIENGADANVIDDYGNTVLQDGVCSGNVEIVKLLLENGADVKGGRLDIAVNNGHVEIAKLLIEKGAGVEGKSILGHTSLYVASAMGYTDVVKLLIEKGADFNARNEEGTTCLDIAVNNRHGDIAKLLIGKGAEEEDQDFERLRLELYHFQQTIQDDNIIFSHHSKGEPIFDEYVKRVNDLAKCLEDPLLDKAVAYYKTRCPGYDISYLALRDYELFKINSNLERCDG